MSDTTSTGERLDALIDFPSVFVFRVMGPSDSGLDASCRQVVFDTLGRHAEAIDIKASSKGTWCSVRVGTTVVSGAEIEALYGALRDIDGVRMVL